MKELLREFFASILGEAGERKYKARNKETGRVVPFGSEEAMKNAIKTGTHEPVEKQKAPSAKTKPSAKKGAVKKTTAKKSATKPKDKSTKSKGKAKKDEPGVTDGMVNPSVPPAKMVTQLIQSNVALAKARRHGRAGAGGQKASYGEIALTEAANTFQGKGLSTFVKQNSRTIDTEVAKLAKPLSDKRADAVRERKFRTVAQQLGLDIQNPDDREKVIRYLATREVYVQQELKKLRADKQSVLYLENGFNGDEAAAAAWAEAQFDGAITTLQLVEEESFIDTSKPFVVIQAEGRPDSHDGAIKAHLEAQLAAAKTKEDRGHYQAQLDAFEHLGFHDTMVVGVDKRGRTTVYHISNKKGNDLEDIWNNTGPVEAITSFRNSFASRLAGTTTPQTKRVYSVLEGGVRAVAEASGAASEQFVDMKYDSNFLKAVQEISSGRKDYTREAMPKDRARAKFEEEIPAAAKIQNLNAKGPAGIKARLAYIKLYSQWLQKKAEKEGKPFKLPGNILRLMTKVAEEMPKLRKKFGNKFTSPAIETCEGVKSAEKDTMGKVHSDIVKAIQLADKGKSKDGQNGPHMQAYIGTVMTSMHFDSMVINYDGHMGAVTGIRGSKPEDFRTCLAEMSGYEGDVSTKKGRMELMNHLLKTCKVNPTTRAIEIVTKDGTHTLAEDSWRTSGTSRKVEKKLGDSIRNCVKGKADSRRKSNPPSVLTAI